MLNYNFNNKCYGCGACVDICPVNAISMKENEEGFIMPFVDKAKCIDCKKCDKICPRFNIIKIDKDIKEREFYTFFKYPKEERLNSTSGGVFWTLAQYFIEEGNYVVGAVWNNKLQVEHIITNDINEAKKIRESKYVQSNVEGIYKKVQEVLKDGRQVLFSGTPCQCAAIRNYTKDDINLYTVAVICEGVPSPKVWEYFYKYMEKTYNSKLRNVVMRSKEGENKWKEPHYKFEFENGKNLLIRNNQVSYFQAFVTGLIQRNSCYDCGIKGNNINCDILMGDYWSCNEEEFKKSENYGISAVGIFSEKGKKLQKILEKDNYFEKTDINKIWEKNQVIMTSIKKSPNRKRFFIKFNETNINVMLNKYQGKDFLKNKLIKITKKIGVYKVIKNIKKKVG